MLSIPEGYQAAFELTVSDAMTVDFQQQDPRLGRLHPVYATYWLTRHAELVSRMVILPFLQEGEEGIGHEVALRHVASALPGMRVRLTARLLEQQGNRVVADVRAVNELGDLVGEGRTTQVILPRARLEEGFERLRRRWREAASHGNGAPGGDAGEEV